MTKSKYITIILALSFLVLITLLIKDTFNKPTSTGASNGALIPPARLAATGKVAANPSAGSADPVNKTIATTTQTRKKIEEPNIASGGNRPNLFPEYRMFWNPLRNDLHADSVDTLQISKAEAVIIKNEFVELQNKYKEYKASNSELVEETDTEAKFKIASFLDEAQAAHQEFFNNIHSLVTEGTYDLMLDGMPVFAQVLGYGGNQQELTIKKIPDSDKFHVNVKSKNVYSGETWESTWPSLSKKNVLILYGKIIEANNSNILK